MTIQTLQASRATALDLANIQGDILIGLQKDAEVFYFFRIVDVEAFKASLPSLFVYVTSCKEVADTEAQILKLREADPNARLAIHGMNMGFTMSGLQVLTGADATGLGVEMAFAQGAHARANLVNDDTGLWQEEFTNDSIHGVLLVTAPSGAEAESHCLEIVSLLGEAIAKIYSETGLTRPAPHRGHEHFGFLDGVSQPGIRGLTSSVGADPNQGLPGQDLIFPGEFVFGYPTQVDRTSLPPDSNVTKDTRGPEMQPPAAWMRNGSYMVFRRLEQKVLAFSRFVEQEAAKLGMAPDLLMARFVGRWPSGDPLVLDPQADDASVGGDPLRNNAFEYQANDPEQRRCPYAAHIRKTYPRDDLNNAGPKQFEGEGGEAAVQTRRLRRAGIPFGQEIGPEDAIGKEASRGLMFVCYQTSIEDQFEFVQSSWANSDRFVFGKSRPGTGAVPVHPGGDPIIGQEQPRVVDEAISNFPNGNTRSSVDMPDLFVIPTAAAYFFMPSRAALVEPPLA